MEIMDICERCGNESPEEWCIECGGCEECCICGTADFRERSGI